MTLPPALRVAAWLGPAVMTRVVTILLLVMLGILAMLAAHHSQGTQGETSHAVLAELNSASQPVAGNDGSTEVAVEPLVVGLAASCLVLIACCALGLALLTAPAWRAGQLRRLNAVAQAFRAVFIATSTAFTATAGPRLVALSISRT